MATRRNAPAYPGLRPAGSRPSGSSAYPRAGSVDSLATGRDNGERKELNRSVQGGPGVTTNSQPVR